MNIPSAVRIDPRDSRDFVRGLSSGITPVVNLSFGDWSTWLPTPRQQKFKYDTDECTQLSGINVVETQLNWLKAQGKLNPAAVQWFSDNHYFDQNGFFALSERFVGILSGTTINGNNPWNFWKTTAKYGILPRQDLTYTIEQSNIFSTQEAMCADYYRKSAITPEMLAKAKQSLQWVQFQYEWIGSDFDTTTPLNAMKSALQQAPLQIAIAVCSNPDWNSGNVPACGLARADHAVECYKIDNAFSIFDQYNPYQKTLQAGYLILQVILGIVVPVPVAPPELASDVALHPTQAPDQAELSYFSAVVQWISQWIPWLR